MRFIADYHTHTSYSDGKGSIEENVLAALARGFSRVAITDHGPGHLFFGARRRNFLKMRREVDALNEKYAGRIEVLLGLELNVISLDGDTDMPKDPGLFDLMLLGYHRGAMLKSGLLSFTLQKRSQAAIKRNTLAYCKALERYRVDIVAHPGEYIPLDIRLLAKAAARTGAAYEINSSHEVTTPEQIEIAKAEGVLFCVGSDAHTPARVGDFDLALRTALSAGLTKDDIVNADGAAAEAFAPKCGIVADKHRMTQRESEASKRQIQRHER